MINSYELTQKNIAIDAEWETQDNGEDLYLTTQIAISDETGNIIQYLLFINEDLYNPEIHQLKKYRDVPVDIIPWKIGTVPVINYFSKIPPLLNIYVFFSPVDCECLLGTENWRYLLNKGFVSKRKNLYVKWQKWGYRFLSLNAALKGHKLNFLDVSGRFPAEGLEEAYKTLNIDTSDGKDYIQKFNVDKSKMKSFFNSHPIEFFEYSLGDLSLHELCESLRLYMNEIVEECFGLKDAFPILEDYPKTIGSLVNRLFICSLQRHKTDLIGILNYLSTSPNEKKTAKIHKILKVKKTSIIEKFHSICNIPQVIHGLGAGSIPAFFPGNYDRNGGSPYGAVVQGGRTIREDRDNNSFNDTFDIDLKSAYGTALSKFDYPFGIPSVVSVSSNSINKPLTLRDILTNYKNDLVDNLYVIYVSGFIKTFQDLIISKYGLSRDIIGAKLLTGAYEDNDDTFKGRLGGQVLLTSKQIELGIITSDVLNLLKKVCSNIELSQFLDLNVELLVYYPKSKELSYTDWVEKFKDVKQLGIYEDNSLIDHRSKEWCRSSLKDFIGLLCQKRSLFKALASKEKEKENFKNLPLNTKQKSEITYKDPDKELEINYEGYDTKQKLLKLIINAVYGDLASPYFPMGNTVVANNITASVRCYSWMMAKALRTKITVTDGGFYQYKDVNYIPNHYKTIEKPSLEKLFYQKESFFLKRKALMDNFDPNTFKKEEIDLLALNHIKQFWKIYDLDFNTEIEHKFENSAKKAIVSPYSKVDYYFLTYWLKEVWKIRGVKQKDIDIHPKAEVIRALLNNTNVNFHITKLDEMLGVNQYLKKIDKTVLPGHSLKVTFRYYPNKNLGSLYNTFEDYKKSIKAYKKRLERYKKMYQDLDLELVPPFEG